MIDPTKILAMSVDAMLTGLMVGGIVLAFTILLALDTFRYFKKRHREMPPGFDVIQREESRATNNQARQPSGRRPVVTRDE